MQRVAPSVIARAELHRLLAGGTDRETNIVSELVEAVTRLVVQELVEGEQADFLGGRGRYERRGEGQAGSRNGYEPGWIRAAEGAIDVQVPQVRGSQVPFRSTLMGFLEGNSEVLERLVTEMYARGLHPRRRGRVPRCYRRAAHLPLPGERDHRSAVGGLPGLRRPGPVRHQCLVPVL
jgi:putative transposase